MEVVRDFALDLELRLEALSRHEKDPPPDSLVEAALACAHLATLATCKLAGLSEDGELLAAAAVHLSAGTARALAVLVEAETGVLDETHAENTLRDARSALCRVKMVVRYIDDLLMG